MANLFKGVVKLTEDQYQLLKSNGSIVVNGTTIQYDDYTLYVTDYAIDGELDLTSSNPVENKVVTKALQGKADVGDIPQNVVTTIDEQEISGNKSFVGTLKYKNDEVATKSEIPVVSDDLKTEHSTNALSVGQGIILNNTITTLMENVNGRVKSFTVNDLNELGALFDIEINEAKDEYEVTKTSINYKEKKYDLITGDIFFVVKNDIPDYWFSLDNMKLYKMETTKVDLSNFYTIAQVDEMVEKKANQTSLDETNKKVEDIEKELEDKVEKEDGKGLSSNDFTTEEKNKLAGIQPGANMNVPSDWNATSGDAAILNKPTKVSQFENDSKFATEDYVNKNGGKIDKIFLNDVEQTITNKEVHLEVDIPEIPTDYYKIKNKLTGINLNTIVEPGNYGVANDCTNMPIAENGTLFVGLYQNNQYAQQMFITSSNNIYTRTSKNIENTNWTSWEKFARSSEIPEQIDYSIYDLVIRTQEEFEAWYTSLDNNTSTAKSVLLVGDGIPIYGSQYIRNDGGGLKLNTSDSGIIIHGINHPNISIEGFVPTNDCPAAICGTSLDSATSGIGSAIKDINIYVLGENEVSAFYALTHIENCTCVVQSALGPAYCFDSCFFVSNIVSIVEGHPMYNTMSFVDCAMITNCLTATSLSGSGEGKAYSYCNCFGISNCVEAYGNSNNVMYNDGCYLINANLEDIPDVSNFITKDVNNLTNYPTNEELNQRLSQLDVDETDPTVPSYVKAITEQDITNWNNKLDSFTEQDPTVPSHVKAITEQNITNWNNKLSSFTEQDPTVPEYVKKITEQDITNWDNKLDSFTEEDPTVPSHVKAITEQNITNWNNKLSSFTEQDPTVPSHVKAITSNDITNWNNKLGSFTEQDPTVPEYVKKITEQDITNWDNKLDSFTEQDPTVPSHVKAISEEDISNWNSKVDKDVDYLTNYTLSAGVGSKLVLSMSDKGDYKLSISLTNEEGTELDKQTIDLPLETMVVGASYDKTNKQITLTLQNGTTTSFSVADLVSGLVPDTRKVNGKALSDDISLNAGDVGALADTTTYVSSVNGNSGAISNIATTNSSQSLYKKNFNQITINEGTCSTASSTAAKVVTLENFELKKGAIIDVTFSNGSYYDTGSTTGFEISLNVNSTGAKKIVNYISSGAVVLYHSKNNYKKWNARDTVRFRYDGTYWTLVANVTSMTSYLAPIFRFPLKYNKSDGSSTYWYGTADLDLTHLLPSTVQYVAQTLTDAQKTQARTNIGAGTSNFSGAYDDLTGKPTIPDVSGFANTSDLANYLPLTAGSDKKLTGPLYPLVTSSVWTDEPSLTFGEYGTLAVNTSGEMGLKAKTGVYIRIGSTTQFGIKSNLVRPGSNNTINLGNTDYKWKEIHGTTIYQNGKQVANKEDLFSRSYNDLTDKPTIPTIPNISVTDNQSGNAVTDVTSSGHTLTLTRANFLEKITYEYNKEVEVSSTNSVNTIGPNAKVCLGKFPCYDSNITIDIKSTTSTPYSGTLVIAMQNIGANTTQTLNAVVYGDPTGAMSSLIYIKMPANNQNTDNIVEVYLNSGRYSKNFIHIKCNGLKATPTDVCTYISSVPSTATVRPTNALTANFANKSDLPSSFVNYVDDIPSSATPNPLLNYVQKSELTSTLSNYLTLNGGTLKGNLTVGSSSIGTNGYIQGTWLKTTADTHLSSTPTQVAVLSNGWIYNRTLEEFKTDLGVGSSAVKVVQKTMQSVSSSTTSTAKLTTEQIELWNRAIAFELAIVKKSSSSSTNANTSSYIFEKHHGGDNYHYCFNPSYGDTFLLCMGVSVNSSGTISAHVSYDLRYKTLIYEDKEYEIPYRKTSFVPGYESGGYIVAYAITKVWVLE
jgi:methyl coenzyme M reductase subunit D